MYSMQYGRAFGFMTDEPGWLGKFIIAAFIPLVPVVGPLLILGYGFEITRRVIKNETPVLPEWSDFGDYLKKGFLTAVVWTAYLLPFAIIVACLNAPAAILMQSRDGSQALTGETLALCGSCLVMLVLVFASLLIPAALGHFAARGSLGSAFQLGDLAVLIRTKPAVYLVSALLLGLLALVLLPIGFLLCVIGMFVGAAFVNIAAAHLFGQAYRVAASEAGLIPAPASAATPVPQNL